MPSGFAALGNVPFISKSVWEYESPLPIQISHLVPILRMHLDFPYKVMKYCVGKLLPAEDVFEGTDVVAAKTVAEIVGMTDSMATKNICCRAMVVTMDVVEGSNSVMPLPVDTHFARLSCTEFK